jgi:hypothetical protein
VRRFSGGTLLSPCLVEGKTISLAEMYIQDQEWRDKWNDKPKLKDIQFTEYATISPVSMIVSWE